MPKDERTTHPLEDVVSISQSAVSHVWVNLVMLPVCLKILKILKIPAARFGWDDSGVSSGSNFGLDHP